MKKLIFKRIIVFGLTLFAPHIIRGQGITYLSNLEQPSIGSHPVASDSWLAALFYTGNNIDGYVFNSIQLGMTDSTGNPSGFTAMIYADNGNHGGGAPGNSIGTLNGSLNPANGGIYTYTGDSSITLSPSTPYYIVITAGTVAANGAYGWSLAGTDSYNPSGGWHVIQGVSSGVFSSIDGSTWSSISATYPQFAITATPVPEPSAWALLFFGSGILIYARRTFYC